MTLNFERNKARKCAHSCDAAIKIRICEEKARIIFRFFVSTEQRSSSEQLLGTDDDDDLWRIFETWDLSISKRIEMRDHASKCMHVALDEDKKEQTDDDVSTSAPKFYT